MIPISPHVPDAGQARRPDSPARSVPPVIDASVNIDHGVTLDISPPVSQSATEGRTRDALNAAVADINRSRIGQSTDQAAADALAELPQMPPGLAQRVGRLLAQLAVPQLADPVPILWPAASGGLMNDKGGLGHEPGHGLMALRQQLVDSPLFDLQRLVDRLMPAASTDPSATAVSTRDPQSTPFRQADSSSAGHSFVPTLAVPDAPQAPRLDQAQMQDGLRLLMHGHILWEGELSPGLFARVEREDGWQGDPNEPGNMVKGSALNVELRLPHLGTMRVRGLQIREAIDLTIEVDPSTRDVLNTRMAELQEGLAQAGLTEVRPRIVSS